MTCPHCQTANRPGARFCARCGAPLAAVPASGPYIHLTSGAALAVPHVLSILSPSTNELALFGLRIPRLPDFLAAISPSQPEPTRLAEVLRRWAEALANLWKWRQCAFALRFLARPADGVTEVTLLARVALTPSPLPNLGEGRASGARGGGVRALAAGLAADLQRLLAALDIPTEPLLDARTLAAARQPFLPAHLVEIRQHEEVARLALGPAYVVHPVWAAAGDFLLPFETLLRQSAPALLSIHLEPTQLAPEEQRDLAQAASIAQSLADLHVNGEYWQNVRIADPQAALVGQVYAANLKRLTEPFLVVAQVSSPDAQTAWTVARAVAAAAVPRGADPGQPPARRADDLPASLDLVAPRTPAERQAAVQTLSNLVLTDWGPTEATPGKERLRYLVDAAGASALFRFPISVRGGMPGIAVRQASPGFELGIRQQAAASDEIAVGQLPRGGTAAIKVDHLTRHGLIVGFTGSGKTNTCLYLLDQLWRQHRIPFLVIEPAKTEYRGLLGQPGFDDLLVFTLGDESTAPFRLNPFELLPGVRVEAHLSALKACFNAALPQFGVLPSIIEEALLNVYAARDWRLTDKGASGDPRLFPTLRDMYAQVIRVADARGYRGELRDNIRAAVAGRVGSLLQGSKGRMFNTQRSIPLDVLLGRPVVLELDSLNDDEKALAMMFLLTLVREHARTTRRGGQLAHVTLIEEAHRVMENVPSVGPSEVAADTRAEAVRVFSGLLAEVRAYGEGILIAEQSPSRLAPDAVRNTNLKIAHMLLDAKDREAIARAMIMDEQQQTFLGKLPVGQAAVFMTGYEKATFVTVPAFKTAAGFDDRLAEGVVAQRMPAFQAAHPAAFRPFDGCRFCGQPCAHREVIEPITLDKDIHQGFQNALLAFDQHPDLAHDAANWIGVARICAAAAARAGRPGVLDAAYCYLAHEIDFPFTPHMRARFETAFADRRK